jgi:hypothetical protein
LLLGSSYSSSVGDELGRLVVLLSLWGVVAVGVSVTFPLVFVAGSGRLLPLVAIGAVLLQAAAAWAGQALFGLDGLALALALTTAVVLTALLVQLHAFWPTASGLASAAAMIGVGVALAFGVAGALLPGVVAAAAGLGLYAVLVLGARPPGLRDAWRYLRALT